MNIHNEKFTCMQTNYSIHTSMYVTMSVQFYYIVNFRMLSQSQYFTILLLLYGLYIQYVYVHNLLYKFAYVVPKSALYYTT